MKKHPMKVILAIDPFESDPIVYPATLQTLRNLGRQASTRIQPVYVGGEDPDVAQDLGASWSRMRVRMDRQAVGTVVRALKVPGLMDPKILYHGSLSIKKAARILAEYARQAGADLIIAQTHGWTGLKRLLLGSFAEELLYCSPVPVLVVGRKVRKVQGRGKILYPTDLGPDSHEHFQRVLELAHRLNSGVTVFHKLMTPVNSTELISLSMGMAAPEFAEELRLSERSAKRIFVDWRKEAENAGVPFETILRRSGRAVARDVLNVARSHGASLIALDTSTGPVESALIGSVARSVMRASPYPVWVLKPFHREVGHHRAA